ELPVQRAMDHGVGPFRQRAESSPVAGPLGGGDGRRLSRHRLMTTLTLTPETENHTLIAAPSAAGTTRTVKRVLGALGATALIVVPVFVFATFITFLLGAASGLSPAAALSGDEVSPERLAQINAELGLDQPLIVQYLSWLTSLL